MFGGGGGLPVVHRLRCSISALLILINRGIYFTRSPTEEVPAVA